MRITLVCACALLVLAGTATAQFPEWQLNSPAATLTVDGVVAGGPSGPPALGTYCTNSGAVLFVNSTLIGQPYDFAIVLAALRPLSAGGLVVGSQVVNMDLTNLNRVYFFNSGTPIPNLLPFPNNYILPFDTGPVVESASAQMVIINPASPDGFTLSQGSQIDIVASLSIPGPTLDDGFLQVNLGTPPLCAVTSVTFFGTAYTTLFVSSNGRLLFRAGDTDYTPTVSEALTGSPFFGLWTDLSPNIAGSITITVTGTLLRTEWTNVPYYNETAATIRFGVEICGACGALRIDQLNHVVANPVSGGYVSGGDSGFLGLSPGLAGVATDSGPVVFAAGTGGSQLLATDMIYDFWDAPLHGVVPALPASLVSGTLSMIAFTPAGNGYTWSGF